MYGKAMARQRRKWRDNCPRARGPSPRDPVTLHKTRKAELATLRIFRLACEPDATNFTFAWQDTFLGARAEIFGRQQCLRRALHTWHQTTRKRVQWRRGRAQVSRCFDAWAWHPDGALMQKMAREFRAMCWNVV